MALINNQSVVYEESFAFNITYGLTSYTFYFL